MRRLTIMLLTYAPTFESPRVEYARQTLLSTFQHLKTSAEVSLHIADDGSPPEYQNYLRDLALRYGSVARVTLSDAERRGYGASYNLATQAIHESSDYVLPLEDDWALTRALYLDPHMDALDVGGFGCIRFGYLGTTQTLLAHVRHFAAQSYWLLHPDSPEPHVFSGHPRLETVAWERQVGLWPEGLKPGETEWEVAKRAREGVVWPAYDGGIYAHIGTHKVRQD